jgi:hypothetical protein
MKQKMDANQPLIIINKLNIKPQIKKQIRPRIIRKSNSLSKPSIQSSKTKLPPIKQRKEKELDVTEIALQNLIINPCIKGAINIKFNHYNKQFPIINGVLKWKDVDEEYSFSFVYRGDYRRDLIRKSSISIDKEVDSKKLYQKQVEESKEKNYVRRDKLGNFFIELQDGEQLILDIEVDPVAGIGAEGLRVTDSPLVASKGKKSYKSGNTAVNDITDQLKTMDVNNLNSEEAKLLKEQRDIEDILYS